MYLDWDVKWRLFGLRLLECPDIRVVLVIAKRSVVLGNHILIFGFITCIGFVTQSLTVKTLNGVSTLISLMIFLQASVATALIKEVL